MHRFLKGIEQILEKKMVLGGDYISEGCPEGFTRDVWVKTPFANYSRAIQDSEECTINLTAFFVLVRFFVFSRVLQKRVKLK